MTNQLKKWSQENLKKEISKILVKWNIPTRQIAINEIVKLLAGKINKDFPGLSEKMKNIDQPASQDWEEFENCIFGENKNLKGSNRIYMLASMFGTTDLQQLYAILSKIKDFIRTELSKARKEARVEILGEIREWAEKYYKENQGNNPFPTEGSGVVSDLLKKLKDIEKD